MVTKNTDLQRLALNSYLENKFFEELRELACLTTKFYPVTALELEEFKKENKKIYLKDKAYLEKPVSTEEEEEDYKYDSLLFDFELYEKNMLKLKNVEGNLLIEILNDVLKKQKENK